MGDRTATSTGRRRGTRLAAAGLGLLMLMGAVDAPSAADEPSASPEPLVVVQNADFSDGTSGWTQSVKATKVLIWSGPVRALSARNMSGRRTTTFVRTALSPSALEAGTTVRVTAQLHSTRSLGRFGMRLREHAGPAQVQWSTSARRTASVTGYKTVTATMRIRQTGSHVSLLFFHNDIRPRQAMRIKNVTAVALPPSTGEPVDVGTPDPTPTTPAPDPTPTTPAPDPSPTTPAPDPSPTTPSPSPTTPTPTAPAGPSCSLLNDASRRTLVFADEFSGTSLDATKWRVRDKTSLSFDAAYIQRENVRVGGGNLTIAGRLLSTPKTVSSGMAERWWSTGYVDTIGTFSREFGRWEMRAKLPTDGTRTKGVWPAFWLRGDRTAGEIDIMETYGSPDSQPSYNPSNSYQATLWEDTNLGKAQGKGHWATWAHKDWQTHSPAIHQDFHVYGVNWTADCLQFTFDDTVVATVRAADHPWMRTAFSGPFNIRLNMQVGSSYWGMPNTTDTKPAFDYVVDYVRAYAPTS